MKEIPEVAPVISYDDDLWDTAYRIDIDYERLMLGLRDMGVPETVSAQTSVNFYKHSVDGYLGSTAHDRLLNRLMFKLPGFRTETAYRMGFRPHQANYPHKSPLQLILLMCQKALRKTAGCPSIFSTLDLRVLI